MVFVWVGLISAAFVFGERGHIAAESAAIILMMIILLVVGTFMDPTPAILVFVPVFLPIVTEFGISPIHFGTMIVHDLSLGVSRHRWATCCSSVREWQGRASSRSWRSCGRSWSRSSWGSSSWCSSRRSPRGYPRR